ncbi:MAG: 50S ribosomal protein L4 [Bdellovibrionota bacterium]
MEALQYDIHNMAGEVVGNISLDPEVFGAAVSPELVHQTVVWQLAKRRAGTHSTKTKAQVSGGGKKPWRQKGRGTARSGSNRSPVWVGGGVAFGPKPRDYETRLSKRTRRQALSSVLTDKVNKKNLYILDSLDLDSHKTKGLVNVIENLKIVKEDLNKRGIAFIDKAGNENLLRASSNLQKVLTLSVEGANVYDLVKHKILVCTKEAVSMLEERIKR